MSDDLLTRFRDAAATPSGDAPLTAIETRLRSRRRRRRGAALLGALAIVAGIGTGVALSGSDGPSVETVAPATDLPNSRVSVDLPPGWVETAVDETSSPGTVLLVGTSAMPPSIAPLRCAPATDAAQSDDAFIQIKEVVLVNDVLLPPQPADFREFATLENHGCTTGDPAAILAWSYQYAFALGDRAYFVILTIGSDASEDEAFAVLNSLRVQFDTPPPPPSLPPTTVPPSTVPPSADTAAIHAAFELWLGTKPTNFGDAAGVIEDYEGIEETLRAASNAAGNPQSYTGRVDAITRIDEDDADLIYTFLCNGQPCIPQVPGRAVKEDGVWKVSRDTICEAVAMGGFHCPPRE